MDCDPVPRIAFLQLPVLSSVCVGGATARVYLATMANERGETERADSLLADVRWKGAEEVKVTGAVEYYLLRGRLKKARAAVRKFTARTESEKLVRQSLLAAVNRRLQGGGAAGSHEPIDRLEQLNRQIAFLLETGRVSQAEAAYRAAEVWLGDDWHGMLIRGKIAAAQGDIETAIASVSHAVSLSGRALHARWELVRMLGIGERKEEAYRQAQLIVDEAPQNGEAWLLLAQTLLDLGKGDDAKQALDTARSLGADNLSVGITTAQALRMMGHPDQAKRLLIRLARLHESSTWPLWQLASWAEDEGDLANTLKWGIAALRRDPEDPGCNVIVGRAFRKQGRVNQALRCLSRVSADKNAPYGWRVDADEELELLKQQRGRGRR